MDVREKGRSIGLTGKGFFPLWGPFLFSLAALFWKQGVNQDQEKYVTVYRVCRARRYPGFESNNRFVTRIRGQFLFFLFEESCDSLLQFSDLDFEVFYHALALYNEDRKFWFSREITPLIHTLCNSLSFLTTSSAWMRSAWFKTRLTNSFSASVYVAREIVNRYLKIVNTLTKSPSL